MINTDENAQTDDGLPLLTYFTHTGEGETSIPRYSKNGSMYTDPHRSELKKVDGFEEVTREDNEELFYNLLDMTDVDADDVAKLFVDKGENRVRIDQLAVQDHDGFIEIVWTEATEDLEY